MGKNNFATILIRILSIYFIVQSIGSLSNLGWIFTFDEMKNSPEYTFSLTNLISLFGPSIAYLICGLILLLFSEQIGIKISLDRSEQLSEIEKFKEMQPVLFSVVGLLVVVFTIGEFLQSIMTVIAISDEPYPEKYSRDIWFSLSAKGFQLIIGFFLIFQAPAISKFFTKLRNWDPNS